MRGVLLFGIRLLRESKITAQLQFNIPRNSITVTGWKTIIKQTATEGTKGTVGHRPTENFKEEDNGGHGVC